MKVIISESQLNRLFLIEAASLDDIYLKYYNKIDRGIFNDIVSSDPTWRSEKPNKMGKFGKWLLKLYLTKKLKLEDKVIFHGQKSQDEILKYYEQADVMLLTLKGNNFVSKTLPLKLQSYMSTGKTILASIEGAAEEIINESGCGICIKPDDYKLLSEKMSYLINNKEVLKDMGKKSREYYEKNFDFDKLMEKFEKEL